MQEALPAFLYLENLEIKKIGYWCFTGGRGGVGRKTLICSIC